MKKISLRQIFIILYAFAAAFLILMVCSRSSFLYPFNNWDDDNCFFTVGKSMFNGIVLYKDIYEQKGPLLYLIYGIAYLMSHTTFIGAFWIEVVFTCVYILALYKICRLYVDEFPSLVISVIAVAFSFSSYVFYFGGSAEELCLPLSAVPVYFILECFKKGDGKIEWYKMIISGFFAGCVFLIKYTALSFALMFVLFVIIEFVRRKNYSGIWKAALLYFAGAVISFIPWLIYFLANGALGDFFTVYIYNNIFIYGNSGEYYGLVWKIKQTISAYIVNFGRFVNRNELILGVGLLGFIYLIALNNFKKFSMDKVFVPLSAVVVYFFAFIAGYGYYYGLPLTFFSVFGFIGIYSAAKLLIEYIIKRRKEKAAEDGAVEEGKEPLISQPAVDSFPPRGSQEEATEEENAVVSAPLGSGVKEFFLSLKTRIAAIVCAAAAAVSVGTCFLFSQNVAFIGYDKNDLFMYKFAAIIEENGGGTILNYGCLDLGLYTVTDTLPNCKYFCGLNIELDDIRATQNEFISEGKVDFVVCEISYPDNIDSHYTLVATDQKRFDDSENAIYLFQKTH